MKKGLTVSLVLLFSTAAAFSAPAPITLDVIAMQPEYVNQEKEIWDLYMKENPNVTVNVLPVNESQEAAIQSRIAAGNPPQMASRAIPKISKDTYKIYANLKALKFPNLSDLSYDIYALCEAQLGTRDYVPGIPIFGGFNFSFLYQPDRLKLAGVDPKSVGTWKDLDAMMAKLKANMGKVPGAEYVFDFAWHSWVFGFNLMDQWAISLGATYQDLRDLYLGKIAWTNLGKDPYVPVLKKLKEYYDKGYMPKKWWERQWETDLEASFISGKDLLTWHGPWLWTKAFAANPNINIDGITLPPGQGKTVAGFPITIDDAHAVFAAYVDKPIFPEVMKAFTWFTGLKIAELQSQYYGGPPRYKKLSDDYVLQHPQFIKLIKPRPDIKWTFDATGFVVAGSYAVKGRPNPVGDDAVAPVLGRYLEGGMTLDGLLQYFQERWKTAYNVP